VSSDEAASTLFVPLLDRPATLAPVGKLASLRVDVGLGVFVEMAPDEALRFCHEKGYHLARMAALHSARELDILSHRDILCLVLSARQTQ
jgi:hypothetical protein